MKKIDKKFFDLIVKNHNIYRGINNDGYIVITDKKSQSERLVPIKSTIFKRHLSILYNKKYDSLPSSDEKKAMVYYLTEHASIKAKLIDINYRVGYMNQSIYIDLCNDKTIIKISKDDILKLRPSKSRRKFIYSNNSLPLPHPNRNVDAKVIDKLWDILIVPNSHHRRLLMVWILNAFYTKTNYPILVLTGERGSAKSTIQTFLKRLIDPETGSLLTLPNKLDDLANMASNRHVLPIDNITKIHEAFSNLMCQISTGGTDTKRKLYTDREESSVDLIGPMILNGVTEFVNAEDLLDRCIIMKLKPVHETIRDSEANIPQRFEDIQGELFGWIINTLQKVMQNLGAMKKPKSLPRMADFYLFGLAVGKALDWKKGTFKDDWKYNQKQRHILLLDDSEVAQVLIDLSNSDTPNFVGIYKDLLKLLQKHDKSLSLKPRGLAAEIRRIRNSLKAVHGIEIKFLKRSNRGRKVKVISNK